MPIQQMDTSRSLRAHFNEATKVRTKSDSDRDFRWLKLFFLRVIRIGRELMPQSPTGDESESQKLMFWELTLREREVSIC